MFMCIYIITMKGVVSNIIIFIKKFKFKLVSWCLIWGIAVCETSRAKYIESCEINPTP